MAGLRAFRRRAPRPVREDRFTVDLGDREIALRVRRHWRARRLTLRIDSASGEAVATIPADLSPEDALDMVHRQTDWIRTRIDALAPARPFADGTSIPFRGVEHRIRHTGNTRGLVELAEGEIRVPGRPEHLARRLTDWLRAEARRELAARATRKAAELGERLGRVTVRDTRSRWGSCSATGNLSFSWRLIMAPDTVIDYVVAHEVAHLRVHDHSPRFWAVVDGLTTETAAARTWLRRHGNALLRLG